MFISKNYKLLVVATLIFLGFLIYSNTFFSPFHFDDLDSIVNNIAIRNIRDINSIWGFWPTRFITYLSLALNYHLHGLNVFGYHLFNLIVHLCTAILVWWFAFLTLNFTSIEDERAGRNGKIISFFIGLMFLVHPLQTQAITYIIQRATSLAALFYMLSICLYVKSRILEQEKQISLLGRFCYVGSFLSATVSILTKGITITLPFTILLYERYFLKPKNESAWKRLWPFLILALIIPLAMLVTKSADFSEMKRVVETGPFVTSLNYLLTQFRVIITYIRLLFIPFNQNLDYDYPILSLRSGFFSVLFGFTFIIAILTIAFRLFPKHRLTSFGIFWFFITLLPESSIIPIRDVIFEHRLYLPMVGYVFFLVSAIFYFLRKKSFLVTIIILILIVQWYSLLTYNRNFDWQDSLVLLNDVIKKSPQKARPYLNRGLVLSERDEFRAAIADFDKALMIYYAQININQNYTEIYKKLLSINNNYSDIYNFLGSKFSEMNLSKVATILFKEAIRINPYNAEAYANLAGLYGSSGKYEDAIIVGKKAIQIDSNSGSAHNNLAVAYYYTKQYDLAVKHYNIAIEIGFKVNPEFIKLLESYRKNRMKMYDRKK